MVEMAELKRCTVEHTTWQSGVSIEQYLLLSC